jgi:hypothetical protein
MGNKNWMIVAALATVVAAVAAGIAIWLAIDKDKSDDRASVDANSIVVNGSTTLSPGQTYTPPPETTAATGRAPLPDNSLTVDGIFIGDACEQIGSTTTSKQFGDPVVCGSTPYGPRWMVDKVTAGGECGYQGGTMGRTADGLLVTCHGLWKTAGF